jgi:signal transduction histidine kinase/ActR/RegA family two-component response regulator
MKNSKLNNLLLLGLKPRTDSPEELRSILLFNLLGLLATATLVLMGSIQAFLSYYLALYVNAVASALLLTAVVINIKFSEKLARLISFTVANGVIATMTFILGQQSNVSLFFFPLLIALTFLFTLEDVSLELIYAIVVTVAGIFISVSIAPYKSSFYHVELDTYIVMKYASTVMALLLTGLLGFVIIKRNTQINRKVTSEKKFLQTVFNNALHGSFIAQCINMPIVDCNQYGLRVFHALLKEDILNRSIASFVDEVDLVKLQEIEKAVTELKCTWEGELNFLNLNDQPIVCNVKVSPVNKEETFYMLFSIMDITQEKKTKREILEQKERAENASKAKGQFLSNMSHELRTPLNAIIGSSNLLLLENQTSIESEHTKVIKNASEQMLSLINSLLDFGKIESGKMMLDKNTFNLGELIQKINDLFAGQFHKKKVKFNIEQWDTDRMLVGDDMRILQVLNNLTANALKFTETGSVVLTSKIVKEDSSTVHAYFEVTDTGIGIAESTKAKIFESFVQENADTTRKYGGTGLGLAISKKLVEEMGASLELVSEQGKGSSFSFTIQLPKSLLHKSIKQNTVTALPSLKGMHVLIVDDNEINLKVLKRFLELWEISFEDSRNGKEAIEKMQCKKFDFVLMDLEMPVMDGHTAMRKVNELGLQTPVIAFTAALFENMKEKLVEDGFYDYLLKPFKPEDLHAKLSHFRPVNIELKATA